MDDFALYIQRTQGQYDSLFGNVNSQTTTFKFNLSGTIKATSGKGRLAAPTNLRMTAREDNGAKSILTWDPVTHPGVDVTYSLKLISEWNGYHNVTIEVSTNYIDLYASFFKDGVEVKRLAGLQQKPALIKALEELF